MSALTPQPGYGSAPVPYTGGSTALGYPVYDEPRNPKAAEQWWLDYLMIAWRRRWVILACVLLGVCISFWQISRAVPIYESRSKLYVSQGTPGLGADLMTLIAFSQQNFVNTQAELITSTPVLTEAVKKMDVVSLKTFAGVANPVGHLREAVTAIVSKNGNFIVVSIESPSAEEAATIVNAVVDGYVVYYGRKKESTATEVLKILHNEKGRREQEMEAKHKEIVAFRLRHEAISLAGKEGGVVTSKYETISQEIATSQLALIEAEAEFKSLQEVARDPQRLKSFLFGAGGNASTNDVEEYKSLLVSVGEQKKELSELLENAAEAHPRVIRLRREIADATDRLAELQYTQKAGEVTEAGREYIEAKISQAQQKYSFLDLKLGELNKSYEAYKTEALELNNQRGQLELLESDWNRAQKVLQDLEDRIRSISVNDGSSAAALNIDVLDVATPSTIPVSPNKQRMALAGIILGLIAGAGVAYMLESLDHRLRSADDIASALSVPVLGMVPEFGPKEEDETRGRWVALHAQSTIAEAYRTIRTAVHFGLPKPQNINGESNGRVVLVTSAIQGEGKSTLSSNLAIAMAQAGQRTLIVDCDLRKPRQGKIFAIESEKGVAQVLAGECKVSEAVVKTDIPKLCVLACGRKPKNPVELLNSPAFGEMIQTLRKYFDQVIVDSPPLLAVADSRLIAGHADGTVLVLRMGKATRRTASESVKAIEAAGARVVGGVVNNLNPRFGGYYGYGQYGYGYGYGYGHDEDQDNGSAKDRKPNGKKMLSRKKPVEADVTAQA